MNKKVTDKNLNALTIMVNEGNLSVFGKNQDLVYYTIVLDLKIKIKI
ncbi:ABC superfamily ATP binding cassette transporter, binding domain protein [Clostridioides difficile DA00165]|nr:ABC superfamily ATP binding cassette transporter, binding domain protein [Clostridioides difficile DA00165]